MDDMQTIAAVAAILLCCIGGAVLMSRKGKK